ncbi:Sec8 exocyst complex component-specific domain-containing protein [Phyllosticta citribraziliensis]|uniref:Exocyst complex component Sec8 n=1 Tax=Phyllosticta citribraziliensis TaxID=989973 RepID=A0ABR1LA78_9PEZI
MASRIPPSARSAANGYANGYYGRYDDDRSQRGYDSGRERRPGGYGGFSSSQEEFPDPRPARAPSSDRSRTNRRSGEFKSRSRPRPNGTAGDASQQIEDVLEYIQKQWSFMTNEECVPVQVALKLLDSSSLGFANRHGEFEDTHAQLQTALKAIVNEHHQGFNSSIGTFHKIQNSLQNSQQRVRTLKDSMVSAKSQLAMAKPELKAFSAASQSYDEMLQVLGSIEQLQNVPERLEVRISEKRFLAAVDVLQDALRLIRKSEMENIGALTDLRVYLSNQEHSLTDILIEELHNHLYLKSPYCEDRWKAYAQNKSGGDGPIAALDARGRSLYEFLGNLDTTEALVDDASRNPESDTFHYIQVILEALNKMSRLDIAIDTIEQRLPVELFRVVEKSNTEVATRHPSLVHGYASKVSGKAVRSYESDETKATLLNDLLWTLYARFEAIAESHRVVHDVCAGIAKRDGLRDDATLTGSFKELWKLYQSEIRSLLHDYLSTDSELAYRTNANNPHGDSVFFKNQRDRTRRMFKLSDVDIHSTDLASERDDLEAILKSSVPGLVSDSKRMISTAVNANQHTQDGSATGHKLLVDPSVFNMGVLLPPSLDFLNRLKEVVPPKSDIVTSTLTSFLDDFLVNVFHPQLDETLVDLCAQTFMEADTFQEDPQWQVHSKKPIFKGTTKFYSLITAFCKMLDNLPHDQSFSQLIITQMVTYYDKCYQWYKSLVSRARSKDGSGSLLKASAALVEIPEISKALLALMNADDTNRESLLGEATKLLLSTSKPDSLKEPDLLTDRKSIAALCLLFTSMKWLASKIQGLRHISERATDSSRPDGGRGQHRRRWTNVGSAEARGDGNPIFLPLNHETAIAFDGVVNSYHELAAIILQSLHLETRCHTMYHISQCFTTTYRLDQLFHDPDPDILKLNSSLSAVEEEVASQLQPTQHGFITHGIALLADTLLVGNAAKIGRMNENGSGRMSLNILVLQQNLKNIEADAVLTRATTYYNLFGAGPNAVVQLAKESKDNGGKCAFSYDELKVLLELYYSEENASERREVAMKAKTALNDALLQLSEYLWQEGGAGGSA